MKLIQLQSKLPFLYGGPVIRGLFKSKPEDFIVSEKLGFELTGQGEHVWLYIRKEGLTTQDIVKKLKQLTKRRAVDIGYAGLKDKHAQTEQWFSVCLANQPEPVWQEIESDQVKILKIQRHDKKLKKGTLKTNTFKIVLRDCQGDINKAINRLEQISEKGMANYFGPQRFGFDGHNIQAGHELLLLQRQERDNFKRGIYLSAIRSAIFNEVLAERLNRGVWDQCCPGDRLSLSGSHSFFTVETVTEDIIERLKAFDVHITGPLIGLEDVDGSSGNKFEDKLISAYSSYKDGFSKFHLESARRALRAPVNELNVNYSDNHLTLAFTLPVGAYATALIREILIDTEELV